jgi:hypothetical protein
MVTVVLLVRAGRGRSNHELVRELGFDEECAARARSTIVETGPTMSQLYQFLASIKANGEITADEVPLIRDKIQADGQLDLDDVKLLVELYCETSPRCAEFDDLFFDVLEKVFLLDGQIALSEEFYLLKMIYSDREILEREREFLRRLRKSLPNRPASFEALFDTAMASPAKNWSVGGRPR